MLIWVVAILVSVLSVLLGLRYDLKRLKQPPARPVGRWIWAHYHRDFDAQATRRTQP
jgi:hypothetical protein